MHSCLSDSSKGSRQVEGEEGRSLSSTLSSDPTDGADWGRSTLLSEGSGIEGREGAGWGTSVVVVVVAGDVDRARERRPNVSGEVVVDETSQGRGGNRVVEAGGVEGGREGGGEAEEEGSWDCMVFSSGAGVTRGLKVFLMQSPSQSFLEVNTFLEVSLQPPKRTARHSLVMDS